MKNLTTALILLISIACSKNNNSEQSAGLNSIKENSNSPLEGAKEVQEFGNRTSFDSSHYSIIRRYHLNGKLYIEAVTDKKSKIDLWKEYYSSGQMKEQGHMTTSNHHYVGKWEYYSENGELDSLVDYDAKQPISYFNAVNIAREYGFKMPDMEVTKSFDDENMYWEVSRWTGMENGKEQSAETILIHSETGKVTKPKYQKIGIY